MNQLGHRPGIGLLKPDPRGFIPAFPVFGAQAQVMASLLGEVPEPDTPHTAVAFDEGMGRVELIDIVRGRSAKCAASMLLR